MKELLQELSLEDLWEAVAIKRLRMAELPEEYVPTIAKRLVSLRTKLRIPVESKLNIIVGMLEDKHDPACFAEMSDSEFALLLDYVYKKDIETLSEAFGEVDLPMKSAEGTLITEQECDTCQRLFFVRYGKDGIDYVEEPCDCEDGYYPAAHFPSKGQWDTGNWRRN